MKRALLLVGLAMATMAFSQFYGHKEQPVPGRSRVGMDAAGMEVKIEQNLGATVPRDVKLTNEEGRTEQFGDLLGRRPIVLSFVFYDCVGVCQDTTVMMGKSFDGMRRLTIGNEYEVVTISIDPTETAAHARSARIRAEDNFKRTEMKGQGWHFYVGEEEEVRRLADAVGFKYKYDATNDDIVHPAGIMVLTPDGRVSQYMMGTEFPAYNMMESIANAASGDIGQRDVKSFYLACINIDPITGARTLNILNILKVFGVFTMAGLGFFIVSSLVKERKRNPKETE